MDPFAVIILGGVLGLFIALVLLGLYYPGSGADQVNWRPTRSPEVEAQNEIDDLDQMLEGINRRRRARGAAELTEAGVRASVGEEQAADSPRREDLVADLEIAQMLEAKNARRRSKGLPEISVEEYRKKIEGEGRA